MEVVLEVDVINNEEAHIGEEKQQHQGLLVRLLGQHLRALPSAESKHKVCDDDGASLEQDGGLGGVIQVPDIQHGRVNIAAIRTLTSS